mmetsp:Transcript_123567/g.174176  ORF Transcript_123567/g.174176 Transcript_123567/m.174176 type:complete len:89 (-) Transcript_123567:163-429(-)
MIRCKHSSRCEGALRIRTSCRASELSSGLESRLAAETSPLKMLCLICSYPGACRSNALIMWPAAAALQLGLPVQGNHAGFACLKPSEF